MLSAACKLCGVHGACKSVCVSCWVTVTHSKRLLANPLSLFAKQTVGTLLCRQQHPRQPVTCSAPAMPPSNSAGSGVPSGRTAMSRCGGDANE